MRAKHLVVAVLTLDADGIALSQTTGGAGNLVLNGAAVVDGVALLVPPRRVTLTSAGNLSAVNFTITGRNRAGSTISQTLAGPNANTVTTSKVFAAVTQIAVSAAVGTAITVGWGIEGLSAPVPLDRYRNPFSVGVGCAINGGPPTFTVEHTFDDVFSPAWEEGTANWFPHETIVDQVDDIDGRYTAPVSAVRCRVSAGTGSVNFDVLQAG